MASLPAPHSSDAIEGEVISPEIKTSTDYKQILVQVADGSTWKAKLERGELVLIEQLYAPPAGSPEPEAGKEEDSTPQPEPEEEPAEAEPSEPEEEEPAEAEESDAEPEDGESYDDMFNTSPEFASSETAEEILSSLPNARGIPEDLLENIKDPSFRARLSSVMLDNKYDRKLRGRTRGKLDMTRLHKAPTMARNLFTQKQSRRGKNYNVCLLVDISGSMSGTAARKAAESTVFALNALEGININTSVIIFNGMIAVAKPWGKKPDYEELYSDISDLGKSSVRYEYNTSTGYNNDYDAMHFAYEYFNKADDGENVLVMFSDGEPAPRSRPSFYNEKGIKQPFKIKKIDQYTKSTKEELHKLVHSYSDVHSVGIGIMYGGWQIPEHEVIHNLDDLKRTLIKMLSKKIKRG